MVRSEAESALQALRVAWLRWWQLRNPLSRYAHSDVVPYSWASSLSPRATLGVGLRSQSKVPCLPSGPNIMSAGTKRKKVSPALQIEVKKMKKPKSELVAVGAAI